MILDLTRAIRSPGEEFELSLRETVAPQDVLGEKIVFDPVELTGSYSMLDKAVSIRGRLRTTAHAACAFCLKPVDRPIDIPFEETFLQVEQKRPGEEEEVDPAQEQFTFSGAKADLEHMVLTLVLLELPLRFECGPQCTAKQHLRRSEEELACQKELPDQRPFSALQQLLTKDQEV